jgi:hypothetical protein
MEDIIDIIVTETTNTIEITSQSTDEVIDVNIIDNREDIVLNVTPTVVEININSLTGNFGVAWGQITGTLSAQTDLNTALGLKADLVGGKVPSSQLPSYVDDVVEVANYAALPATGETGKIYVTLDTNKIYRWSGSAYVEIIDSAAVWGAITGTLSSQTDLQSALDAKLSTTTAASTYVPYTGATGDVNLGVNVLKSNNVILDGDTSATGYLGFKQFSGAQGGGLGYSSISATGLTKFYFRAYQTGTDVKSFNFDLASLTNLTERNYTLPDANGTLALTSNLSAYVPYTGATANIDLGTHTLLAAKGTFSSSGSSDTVGITHSSGSGIALNISKAGNGEGIYVNKSSGSGNAVTIVGTLNATTLVKNGGTSSQFLKADGSVDSTSYQPTLTNPVTGTGTSGIVAKFNGTSTLTDSIIYDNGTRVSIGADVTTSNKFVSVASTSSSYAVVAQASGSANGFWATLSGSGEIFRGQTSGGSYFIINNGGNAFLNGNLNVGDFASTSYKLKVNGTANFTDDVTFDGGIGAINFSASTTITNTASSGYTAIYANGGGVYLGGSASTNHLTITSGGNVGIGTTSPSKKLHIYGTDAAQWITNTSSTNYATIAFLNNVGENMSIGIGGSSASSFASTGYIVTGGSYPFVLGTNDTERMRITSAGNVGIGTTSPTTYSLAGRHLELNDAGGGYAFYHCNTTTVKSFYASNESALLTALFTFSNHPLTFGTNNTERMRITSGGNVGIGTTSPSQKLAVVGDIRGYKLIGGEAGVGAGNYTIFSNDDNVGYIDTVRAVNSGDFQFRFDGTSRATINRSTGVYVATSDINKKKDLEESKIGLSEVMQLKPTLYRMKTDDTKGEKELGFIAQEVKGIIPSAYQESGDFIGLNFNPIVAALTKAIQELKAELDILKNK